VTSTAGPAYVAAVLLRFAGLPDTPRRASAHDKAVARSFFERGVPLEIVESALLLGSLRRRNRPAGASALPPVRSLAYFSPLIDEILQQPPPAAFHAYLRSKAETLFRPEIQKSTFSDDR
jgi:hypothetical protein